MRFIAIALALLAIAGCAKKDATPTTKNEGGSKGEPNAFTKPIDAASLVGEYVGTVTNRDINPDSSLPPSMSQVIGDGTLSLKQGGKFDMVDLGFNVSGTYELAADQLVLHVEEMEGISKKELSNVDLAANKRAGKEPSTKENLEFFTQVMLVTDWRFELKNGGFNQIGDPASTPLFEFKPKQT